MSSVMAGLSRPSTTFLESQEDVDARHKAGHAEKKLNSVLAVDGDLIAARARNADHDRILALVFGQHQVAVIGFAGQQFCPADAAGTGFARTRHIEPMFA